MEPVGSLPYSQASATCPYPGPTQSSPTYPHPTSWRSILILSTHLRLGLPSGLFPSGFSLCILRDASPRNTPPPGEPSGGVIYLRIVLSPEEASCLQVFLNMNVLQGGVVSTSPNPQAGGPPLVGCPRLLIQFIRSYPP